MDQLIDEIRETTGYFAHPCHSRKQGRHEHADGLILQHLPKRTDFNITTNDPIDDAKKTQQTLRKMRWLEFTP